MEGNRLPAHQEKLNSRHVNIVKSPGTSRGKGEETWAALPQERTFVMSSGEDYGKKRYLSNLPTPDHIWRKGYFTKVKHWHEKREILTRRRKGG